MSNTQFSPLPSLRLSDDAIPPATATLCRWHPQPRPRPPKLRSFSTPARGPRHARQPKSPTPLPIQAGSSLRERPSRAAGIRKPLTIPAVRVTTRLDPDGPRADLQGSRAPDQQLRSVDG